VQPGEGEQFVDALPQHEREVEPQQGHQHAVVVEPQVGLVLVARADLHVGRARGHLHRRRGEADAAVLGRDHRMGPGSVRDPQASTQVVGILDAIEDGRLAAEACMLVSNNRKSGALEFAQARGVPHPTTRGMQKPGETAPGPLKGSHVRSIHAWGVAPRC